MQLCMPLMFVLHFYRQRDYYSSSVMFFWFGENMFHIAPYVRDARTQALPLVGGGGHDWAYLLGRMNILQYDQHIASMVWNVGCIIIIASILMGLRIAFHQTKESADIILHK